MTQLQEIKISQIQPTEFLIPEDRFNSLMFLYEKTSLNVKPIHGYLIEDTFVPEDGNNRSLLLYEKGLETIPAYVNSLDEFADDVLELAEMTKLCGVSKVSHLKNRKVAEKEYNSLREITDLIRNKEDLNNFFDAFGLSSFEELMYKITNEYEESLKICKEVFGVKSYSEVLNRVIR